MVISWGSGRREYFRLGGGGWRVTVLQILSRFVIGSQCLRAKVPGLTARRTDMWSRYKRTTKRVVLILLFATAVVQVVVSGYQHLVTSTPVGKVSAIFGCDECVVTPQEIEVLGRKLGTVTRMCPKSLCMGLASPVSCLFLRLNQEVITHGNIMTPSLISIPLWLRHSSGMFKNQSYLGFYSRHTESTSHGERGAAHPTLGLFVAENLEFVLGLIFHTYSKWTRKASRATLFMHQMFT